VKVADEPDATVTDDGWVVIAGAVTELDDDPPPPPPHPAAGNTTEPRSRSKATTTGLLTCSSIAPYEQWILRLGT
jgi:hypothetical protein